MKERASFTFDKETLQIIDELEESGEYRNRSHIVEHAIRLLGNEKLNGISDIKKLKKFIEQNS